MGTRACNWAVLLVGPALAVYCTPSAAGAATAPAVPRATGGAAADELHIEATGNPVHAARGARVGYTVQAHNPGPRAVDAAVRLAAVSPGLSIAAADSDPACTLRHTGYVCTRTALDPGATASWTVYGDIDGAASGSVRVAFARLAAAPEGEGAAPPERGAAHGTAEVATTVDPSLPVASPDPGAEHGGTASEGPSASPSSPAPAALPEPSGFPAGGLRSLPLTGDNLLGLGALAFGLIAAGATLRMLFGSRRR